MTSQTVTRYDLISSMGFDHPSDEMVEDPEGAWVPYAEYAALLQAVTDPENQPSQFGTRLVKEKNVRPSNQCLHAALTLGKDGWHCAACLRMFLPSGDTGAEQETVRLRYLLNGARAYIRSFAELTQHSTARADAMKLIERIDGLRPVETPQPAPAISMRISELASDTKSDPAASKRKLDFNSMRIRHAIVEGSKDKAAKAQAMAYLSHLDRADLLSEVVRLEMEVDRLQLAVNALRPDETSQKPTRWGDCDCGKPKSSDEYMFKKNHEVGCKALRGEMPSEEPRETSEKQMNFIDVVFDGPPSHLSGRFVETEDPTGKGISAGQWIDRGDGLWALRIPSLRSLLAEGVRSWCDSPLPGRAYPEYACGKCWTCRVRAALSSSPEEPSVRCTCFEDEHGPDCNEDGWMLRSMQRLTGESHGNS